MTNRHPIFCCPNCGASLVGLTPLRQRAMDLARGGLHPAEIAEKMGVSYNSVSVMLTKLRKSGHRIPYVTRRRSGPRRPLSTPETPSTPD
jgi:transposase